MNRWIVILSVLAMTALAVGSGSARHELSVGNSSVVVRSVTGTLGPDVRRLMLNDNVYFNELIATQENSATEITFLDNTKITLGEDSEIIVDSFIYDPDPSKSAFALTVSKGAMRFVSGNLPNEAYSIKTPSGTVGIRGTTVDVVVEEFRDASDRLRWRTEITFQDGLSVSFTCQEITRVVSESGMSAVNQGDGIACSEPDILPQSPAAREKIQTAVLEVLANLEPTSISTGSAVIETLMDSLERDRATFDQIASFGTDEFENEARDTTTRLLQTSGDCEATASLNVPCRDTP